MEGAFYDHDNKLSRHTRLSVIDLNTSANQPMASSNGQYIITYNGEIYNYRDIRKELCAKGHIFETKSDTKLFLKVLSNGGKDCLVKFRGMFSLCL